MTATRTLSQEQQNYIAAKALYETNRQRADEFSKPFMHLLETEEGIEEFTNREVDFSESIGLWASFDALVAAERALLGWCREVVKTNPRTAKKYSRSAKELDNLFDKCANYPNIREGMIKIAMELTV